MIAGIFGDAKMILQIAEEGQYKDGQGAVWNIEKELEEMERGTQFIQDVEVPELSTCNSISNFKCLDVELTTEKTVDAISRLSKQFNNIGVLNFASAKNPGGGFFTGAQAQEESLCYASFLYKSLVTDEGDKYYEYNAQHNLPDYTDCMIYSPNVPFIRDSNKCFHKPICVDVLTSPAVNRGALLDRPDTKAKIAEYDAEMLKRMFKILWVFKETGCKCLILGAYGCGVFGNMPIYVARNWVRLLNLDVFKGCYDKVVFAVFDRPPRFGCFSAFEDVMGSRAKVLKG